MLLADQPALGAVIVEHAVELPWMPILCSIEPQTTPLRSPTRRRRPAEIRHEEKRDALRARRRALDAREHEMNDVVGQIVLAGGDENLLAGDRVGAVGLRDALSS